MNMKYFQFKTKRSDSETIKKDSHDIAVRNSIIWIVALVVLAIIVKYLIYQVTKESSDLVTKEQVYWIIKEPNLLSNVLTTIFRLLITLIVAIFIAVFVIFKLDNALKKRAEEKLILFQENLNKDIFETVFKRIIPDEIFRTVKSDIILTTVCRRDFKIRYEFIEMEDGSLKLIERSEYNLLNITQNDLHFPIKLPDNDDNFKLVLAKCETDHKTITYDPSNKEHPEELTITNGNPDKIIITTNLPPETGAIITTTYSKIYNRHHTRNITREYFFNYPTINASIEIIFPSRYELEISHWLKSLLKVQESTETRRSFDFKQSVLPNVGFVFSLDKKDEPIQNMEALGIVTDNMIHNFNNQLHVIINSLDLAYSKLTDRKKVKEDFDNITNYLEKFRGTLSTLENYSECCKAGGAPLKLSLIMNEAIRSSLLKSTVLIIPKFEAQDDTIMSNALQVRFVIISLIDKLCERIDEHDCVLELSIKNEPIEDPTWVKLTIAREESPNTLKLCTDIINELKFNDKQPFSKIDLNHIKEEVEKLKGRFEFFDQDISKPTFEISFKVIENNFQSKHFDLSSNNLIKGKNEKILFVDDDPEVSDITKEFLEKAGYIVSRFICSERALEKFKNDYDNFDLVITDMNMPVISGISLGKQMKEIRPDIPIIISSGGDEMIDSEKIKELKFESFISKPYTGSDISNVIATVLASQSEKNK